MGQHLFSKAGGKTGRCKGRATFGSFTVKMRGSTFSVKTQVLGGHDQKVQGKVNQLLYGKDAGQHLYEEEADQRLLGKDAGSWR